MVPSGVRMGTPALTSRGYDEKDFVQVAEYFDEAVKIASSIKDSTFFQKEVHMLWKLAGYLLETMKLKSTK